MAVPNYGQDLTVITLCESTAGFSAYGGGASGLAVGPDFAIQGSNALDKQVSNADKGAMFNDGTVSLGANDHIFGWIYAATPGILDTLANGGKVMSIGTGTGAFNKYALEGSDTRPEGGNKPYVVRYSTSVPSPGSQVGSPGAAPTYFGGGLNTTASAKGPNLGLDAIRYGTGAYITAGEVANPATLDGFATQDELTANKWGTMFRQGGAYQWQGRFVTGQDNTGTPTAAHFDDSESASVSVLDTPHAQADFTQWIIDHASTFFACANKTFSALGTHNRGRVVINNANATSTGWSTCTWNDFGAIQGHANVPYDNCTFNRCDQIDQNGGEFTNGVVNRSTASTAMSVDDLSLVTGMRFVSDGTGYAMDLGTISATQTLTYDNIDTGYAATDGSTGNETIRVNVASGQTLTLNVAAGATTPTIHNVGAGTVNVVSGQATVTFTGLAVGGEFRIYDDDGDGNPITLGTNREGTETLAATSYILTHPTSEAGNIVNAQYIDPLNFEEKVIGVTLAATNQTIEFDLTPEENI